MAKQPDPEQCDFSRSPCPVANMLDILGDKWTLLVVRDIFLGKRQYGEFLNSPEGIPTNILAERLKRLVEQGIVVKQPYQQNPVRYEYTLTTKGKALFPVLREVARWGLNYVPGTRVPDEVMAILKSANNQNNINN
jgi:DNA-binding HxlR family transcriptional regulator